MDEKRGNIEFGFTPMPAGADARPFVPGARPEVPLKPQPARSGVPGAAGAAGQQGRPGFSAVPPLPGAGAMPGVLPGAMPAGAMGGTPFTVICPEGYLPVIKFVKIPERTPRDQDPAGASFNDQR